MHPHSSTWAIILAIALLLIGSRVYSYNRFKTLHWPRRLGYYGFKRRIVRYLRRGGWRVDTKPWVPIDFYAYRKGQKIAVVCLPSETDLTTSRVRDLASMPPHLIGNRQVVSISLDEVPRHFVADAAENNVKLLWYKNLASL